MKMLRRSVCLLLCAALFLTLLAGCGKQEEPAEDAPAEDEAAASETTAAAVTEEIAEAQPAAADVDAEDEAPADEKTSEEFWAQDESQLKLDPPPAPAAEDEAAAPDYAAFKGVKFSE